MELYKKIGSPKTLKELGISLEEFLNGLKSAPKIRERYTILNKYSSAEIATKSN